MTDLLTLENLWAWVLQVSLIVGLAALLPGLFRLRAPRWHLLYLQSLLALSLLLPAIQPWNRPVMRAARATLQTPVARSSGGDTGGFFLDWATLLPYALAAGVAFRFGWLALGVWRLRQFRKQAKPLGLVPAPIAAAERITGTSAHYAVSDDIAGPVTFGWLAPVILVPPAFGRLPAAQQTAVACHELLHVRRRDWAAAVMEELAAALVWFQPAVWLLLRQLRLAREHAVDAAVVRLTGSRHEYIEALLAVAQTRWQLDVSPAPLFLKRRQLTNRVQQLLKEASMSRRRICAWYATMLTVLATAAWFGFTNFPLTATPQAADTQTSGVLEKIEVSRLSEPQRSTLRDRLARYVGQPMTNDLMAAIRKDSASDAKLVYTWRRQSNGNHALEIHTDMSVFEVQAQPEFPVTGPEKRIRVGGEVQSRKLLVKTTPEYPATAKLAKQQGVVRLAVLVGSDGRVKQLYTMSGHELLAQAAEAAVSNWVYETTLLNGEPVEVATVVDVNFTLLP